MLKRQGSLTRAQLKTLCEWKSKRRAGDVMNNSPEFVEEITRFALSAQVERSRIESLTLLDGVAYPTASAILHWFHPNPYPILDIRALWSLRLKAKPPYAFDFWQKYVQGWRELLRRAQRECSPAKVTPRMLDKALWMYSKENQPLER
jgi:hypothetical protein